MRDDLKSAFRSLRASKTFTAVALLVLTLGIGAGTAIFSVVDAVVLRGLPFDEHDRLVAVGERRPPNPNFPRQAYRDPQAVLNISPDNYRDWVARQDVFEAVAGISEGLFVILQPGLAAEELRSQRVTASFFTVLRVQARLGRAFTEENEIEGRHRVAVLSHAMWTGRFGSDPDIIGKTMAIDGGPYEVIGVMPPGFQYPIDSVRPTDLWVPANATLYVDGIARLKAGVSVEQAQANMDQIAAAIAREHPARNTNVSAGVRPLRDHIVGARTAQWMLLLLGAVAMVLLIACANVANLLLARATSREREVGIHAAMGADRWRLMRQLMIESLVLSTIGTLLAVLLAWWLVGVLKNSMPDGVPRIAAIALDLRVLGAAAALSLITAVAFGIVPALQLSRPDLTKALKDAARGAGSGRTSQRIRRGLVVVEVALAVILLVGAALFIGSFRALMQIDLGFDPAHVLTVSIVPHLEIINRRGTARTNEVPDYGPQLQELIDRVRQTPGVQDAGAISGGMPLGGSFGVTKLTIPGRALHSADSSISIRRVTPDYHRTMGMTLKEGRSFDATDRQGATTVVIINESAAKKYFPGESAVGKSVNINNSDRTVVGIVGDVYQTSLETEPRTEAYLPMAQQRTSFAELVIRTSDDPYAVLPAVKAAALGAMPGVLLRDIRTMEEVIARHTAQRRLSMLLLGLFGLLGLVIAAVGVYGVMAYVVAQRTREIGVRTALGATRGTVLSMVLGNTAMLIGAGLVIGGVGAWLLSSSAKAFLFRIDATDPRAFAAALGVLALAALVATVIPARRAASVDPAIALRAE